MTLHSVPQPPRFDESPLGPERLRACMDYLEADLRQSDAERSAPIIEMLEACKPVTS
jgi:hypothetical protein